MRLSRHISKIIFAAIVVPAFAPLSLFACAACGSANSSMAPSPLTNGMNLGILTLFVVIASVLGAIATFFVFIIRREGALAKTLTAKKQPA